MGLSSTTLICVECRVARKGYSASCGVEGHKMIDVGTRFRAPKKRDAAAWKRIAEGDRRTEFSKVELREFNTKDGYYVKDGKRKNYRFIRYWYSYGAKSRSRWWDLTA